MGVSLVHQACGVYNQSLLKGMEICLEVSTARAIFLFESTQVLKDVVRKGHSVTCLLWWRSSPALAALYSLVQLLQASDEL